MTAGKSKGKRKVITGITGARIIKNINLSAIKLHGQLEELIKELSLPPAYIEYLKQQIEKQLQQQTKDKDLLLQDKRRELQELFKKIERVEEKYINDDLDKDTYKKFKDRYQREVAVAQKYIVDFSAPVLIRSGAFTRRICRSLGTCCISTRRQICTASRLSFGRCSSPVSIIRMVSIEHPGSFPCLP
jgi:antitoxin component of MazEF toxin-antitoxin module